MKVLGAVDYRPMADWIAAIPFTEWPQQDRLADGIIRPAMVTDPAWHGFGAVAAPIVAVFGGASWLALSCVMPGHAIPRHTDAVARRIHVPLLTNARATFNGAHLAAGFAYDVDPRAPHEIRNDGTRPRVHFMFDPR